MITYEINQLEDLADSLEHGLDEVQAVRQLRKIIEEAKARENEAREQIEKDAS